MRRPVQQQDAGLIPVDLGPFELLSKQTGAVYQPAAANTLPTPVNLGTVRTGTVVNTTLGVTNIAPAAGLFNETLAANFGSVSSGLVGTGNVSGLAQGASSNALSVAYTAGAAGAYSGSTTVAFTSQSVGGSGLSDLALDSQTVNFTANVNALAVFNFTNQSLFSFTSTGANSATLDFGTLASASSLAAPFLLTNSAIGPSDSLLGSFDVTGLNGSIFSFAGAPIFALDGGVSQAFSLLFDPQSFGNFSSSFVVNFASHNAFQSDLNLGNYTITMRGSVRGPNVSHGVPDTSVGLIGALTLITVLVFGTRHRRRTEIRHSF